ncbi:hypothetical protein TESG_05365 [Trichophyton tonsurans CBS 112818]|uniref:Uncharacterized protein n=1 Tax=Trichophyton tonsurans (strain CBS 112818) TaxID=647933 RepID=F2S2R2_TRIT1|nr:hypothetical protein TESG_05365 [Trichophyton tonsurans CBS 112818]
MTRLIIPGDPGYKEFRIRDGSVISGSITLMTAHTGRKSITRAILNLEIYSYTFKGYFLLFVEEGFVARSERRKHVRSYFDNGLSVTEWVPAQGHKPNWASASDGVFQVVDFPPFECVILKEGVIYKAQAIAY